MASLNNVEYFDEIARVHKARMRENLRLRDLAIKEAFENGFRHKEIANAIGISESRVKKIIGELRKHSEVKS